MLLLNLAPRKCRWPISATDGSDLTFCNNIAAEGVSYCAGMLVWRTGSRRNALGQSVAAASHSREAALRGLLVGKSDVKGFPSAGRFGPGCSETLSSEC